MVHLLSVVLRAPWSEGERVRGAETLVVKHEHIREVLNLRENEWYKLLEAVREFTRGWVARSEA